MRQTELSDFFRHWRASFSGPSLSQICVYRSTPRGHLYLRRRHLRLTSFDHVERADAGDDVPRAVQAHFGIDRRWTARAQEVLNERRRSA